MKAATNVFNERTYTLATMTEIAATLGLRDATLYYYFPSKQALFNNCLQRSADRFEAIVATADDEGVTGSEKLERFLSELVADSERDGPLLYFGDYHHLASDDRKEMAARAETATATLERFIKSGIDDGSIAPCEPRLVVNLLLGMLIWLARWVPRVEGLTARRLLDAMDAFALRGLRAT